MSFILDALKKSENDRQRQSGPALFEVRVAPPRSKLPLLAIVIVSLLVVNLGVVGWIMLRKPAAAAVPRRRLQRQQPPAATPAPANASAAACRRAASAATRRTRHRLAGLRAVRAAAQHAGAQQHARSGIQPGGPEQWLPAAERVRAAGISAKRRQQRLRALGANNGYPPPNAAYAPNQEPQPRGSRRVGRPAGAVQPRRLRARARCPAARHGRGPGHAGHAERITDLRGSRDADVDPAAAHGPAQLRRGSRRSASC